MVIPEECADVSDDPQSLGQSASPYPSVMKMSMKRALGYSVIFLSA